MPFRACFLLHFAPCVYLNQLRRLPSIAMILSFGMAFVHPIAVMGLQLLTGGVSVGGIAYYQKQYALEPQEQEKVTQIFKEFQKTLRDLGVAVENYSPEDLYVNWESLISSQPLINPPAL